LTFRDITELQENAGNAAHTGATMHMVETNGWNQLDRRRRWITAGDGSQEMDPVRRRIAAGYASRPDMDHWRCMTGDGCQEMGHTRRMTIILLLFHEAIEGIRSYTLLEIAYYDFNPQSYNPPQICRHMMYCRRSGSSEYDTDQYSEHDSEIPNYVSTCPSHNAEYDP